MNLYNSLYTYIIICVKAEIIFHNILFQLREWNAIQVILCYILPYGFIVNQHLKFQIILLYICSININRTVNFRHTQQSVLKRAKKRQCYF